MRARAILVVLLGGLAGSAGIAAARRQVPATPAADATSQTGVEPAPQVVPIGIEASSQLDAVGVEAFVDGFMASYLEESGAVGGAVSIVEGGRIVLAKGYGDADRAQRREVDPRRTLFRIGSVSKLFVWTAVMQLVEQGKLDLAVDVNRYLDSVSVPETFPDPVTLAHLMTHTAGFEDHVLGLFGRDAQALRPLDALLAAELPARVRSPGALASYSNHGTALAMLIVERVSGTPWIDYLEKNIIGPLGMTRTTFRQPVPPGLSGDLSVGYEKAKAQPEPAPFEYVPLGPAGAASSTASDMARFMIAHLALGELGEKRILSAAAAREMQRSLYRPEPGVSGMAHGFIEGDRNGHRVIGHGGDTLWFHTALELYPEDGIGLFASFNTAGADPYKLAEAFADRYFPTPEWSPPAPPADWLRDASRFSGAYRSVRYSHHDLTKIAALLMQVEVSDDGPGALRLSSSPETRWRQVEPLLFRDEKGTSTIAFRGGRGRTIAHLFLSDVPVFAFERVPWHESRELHGALLGGALLLFLVTVAIGPAGILLRWRYQAKPPRDDRLPWLARAVVWLGSLVFVVFFAGLALSGSDPNEIVFGVTPRLRQLLLLPIVGAALAAASLLCAVWIWGQRRGGALARLGYTLVVVAFLTVLWQLAVWRLLGR
jgi:CubicO group peptidase (beta-lactamase class C family)